MIDHVTIRDLGVIAEGELATGPGLTALTGETGAGKTMAVTSLQLLLGAKADASRVRAGARAAEVEGTFVIPADSPVLERVTDAGGAFEIEGENAILIVARHVPAKGRSRAYVGGRSVPTAVLREIASAFVTVHGQSDQIRLASGSQQRTALDAYGGEKITAANAQWQQAYRQYLEAGQALHEFEAGAREAAQRRLAYTAFLEKIEAVAPTPGEEEELRAQALRLENSEELYAAFSRAAGLLTGSDAVELPASRAVAEARAKLSEITDPTGQELAGRLASVEAEIDDVGQELAAAARATEAQPELLSQIYSRRQELAGLRKELGMDIDSALDQATHARRELEKLGDPEGTRETIEKELREATAHMEKAGKKLRTARQQAGAALAAQVTAELPALSLPDAKFEVRVEKAEPGPSGADTVEFLLASHRGAPLAPLGKGASGGELSRVMLAVEVSLASQRSEGSHTFLFDEIDAGIGGKAATAVGKRLAKLAETAQVIVVTHLPQVAAFSTTQIAVVKQSTRGTARTEVVELTGEERISELARMLSGNETDVARAHAAELLRNAFVAR
ncbi:DNA repair protein RecN (Recombination protein N) [Actinobaculum suis]|uniref:DNA repair protein RecN n=1 Tax=Actinobaculum suis TaxID=1657 RepID=A0A1G7E9S0_9ACTO|nr:DNA repair protein RecN [Actinobaculum suis]MDY5153020.1 DNA repair protein RecN [Actinobaculum suis]SDE60373.1 DNA repair protein RecN (Recombination protein N) [Actinobaculum suis]